MKVSLKLRSSLQEQVYLHIYFLLSLFLTIGAVLLILENKHVFNFIFLLIFASSTVLIFITIFQDKTALLDINGKGIFMKSYKKIGIVPWSDVRSVNKLLIPLKDRDGSEENEYVAVVTNKSQKYMNEIKDRQKGYPVMRIYYPGKISADEVLEIINLYKV